MTNASTIQQARETIAKLAEADGEIIFAREVRAGCWDHRDDVKSAIAGTFKPHPRFSKNLA